MWRRPPSGPPERDPDDDPDDDPDADPPGEWDPTTDPVDPVPVAFFTRLARADVSHMAAAITPSAPPREAQGPPAFDELYETSFRELVATSAALIGDLSAAHDVVQEAFIILARRWPEVEPRRTARQYIRLLVMRLSRDFIRDRYRSERPWISRVPPEVPSTEQQLVERSVLLTALNELPDDEREAVFLRFYAQLRTADIADVMRISRGKASQLITDGLSALRRILGTGDEGDTAGA